MKVLDFGMIQLESHEEIEAIKLISKALSEELNVIINDPAIDKAIDKVLDLYTAKGVFVLPKHSILPNGWRK